LPAAVTASKREQRLAAEREEEREEEREQEREGEREGEREEEREEEREGEDEREEREEREEGGGQQGQEQGSVSRLIGSHEQVCTLTRTLTRIRTRTGTRTRTRTRTHNHTCTAAYPSSTANRLPSAGWQSGFPILCCAFSRDGAQLALCGGTDKVRVLQQCVAVRACAAAAVRVL
jgi:hypothetical protein